MSSLTIALDYDGTFTAAPTFWHDFITMSLEAGHKVICVTSRTEESGAEVRRAMGADVPVVFAGIRPKREAAKARGYDVAIWIDDMPETIGRDLELHI